MRPASFETTTLRAGALVGALATLLVSAASFAAAKAAQRERVVVGSKAFAESWILGEATAILARRSGAAVDHRSNLGGTEILSEALRTGSIDVYPEYTGTIAEVVLKVPGHPPLAELRTKLATEGLGVSDPLGFDDSYALAVTRATQERYGLKTISDLAAHPELELGLTHEFIGRADGYKGLARHYGLAMPHVRGIQHEMAYRAMAAGTIHVMDIYTTDPQIRRLDLRILEDDRGFFPRYDAVLLYRLDLPTRAPRAFGAIRDLVGAIDGPTMIRANESVLIEKVDFRAAAERLLSDRSPVGSAPAGDGAAARILSYTAQHLRLVALSLLAAILVGVPLGILATRSRLLETLTLSGAGVLQTIPSLALLAFLIPFLGIGAVPALVALFLYCLLPIVRNTYTGLTTIPPALTETAEVLGLSRRSRLLRVMLPLASPAIMAGIKTSAVICVGMATLAALIGAGGLGDPILSGIQLQDRSLILQGAVPAALLALLVQWGFDLLDRFIVPKGLRLSSNRS